MSTVVSLFKSEILFRTPAAGRVGCLRHVPVGSYRTPPLVGRRRLQRARSEGGGGATQHEMLVYGDTILVLGTATGVGRKTGIRLEVPFAHVWVTREGQIVEFRQYIDPARFLAAIDQASA
jgi:hypothetical protein